MQAPQQLRRSMRKGSRLTFGHLSYVASYKHPTARKSAAGAATGLLGTVQLRIGERYLPLNLSPQKRKERTLHAQLAQVQGLAARQPVLLLRAPYAFERPFNELSFVESLKPEVLARAIEREWCQGRPTSLSREFAWPSVASQLRQIYAEILGRQGSSA